MEGKIVTEFEQAVILRLGHIRKGGAVRPGVYFILPCIDMLIKVDMRTRMLNIPLQEVLTKDPLSLDVDGVIYYRIENPQLAVKNITNPDSATLLLTQITFGNVLGSRYLSQIICNRDKIAQDIQSIASNALSAWGIKVEQIEIKNVKTRVKASGSPISSGGSMPASPHSLDKVNALDCRMDAPRTVKKSSITITESPTSLKFHCVQTEITGRSAIHNSTDYAITEGNDFGEGPNLTEG
ncbi:stomatin-like [Sceloporus undulatus]|uniref:stomatin-like n=1 Tax=Sceloporus undulatus TaxID=8520 RepID=UPI001C4CDDD7|nr:stomatin-like [Sceloporus undulatus]